MGEVLTKYTLIILLMIKVISYLPNSPVGNIKRLIIQYYPYYSKYLAYANWFLPISEVLSFLEYFILVAGTLQLLMIVGRIISLFPE